MDGPKQMLDSGTELPIVVDIDGVLIRSRWFDEALLEVVRERPLRALRLPIAAVSGRAAVEEFVVENAKLDVDGWPESVELVAYLREQAENGRRIVLVTNAPEAVTSAFARRYPFIGDVVRLAGRSSPDEKARRLANAFPQGFVYAGSPAVDLPTWNAAERRLAVNAAGTADRDLARTGVERTFDAPKSGLSTLRRAMRLHQWAKNLLVFVPLLLGGRGGDPAAWMQALMGCFAISLVASAMYLINDVLDLPSDRRHWSKRERPIAGGAMSIRIALTLAAALVFAGLALAATQGAGPLLLVLLYMAVTLCYSAHWKSVPILDVFILACLFTLRLWLGIELTHVRVSPWLLVFSMFLFLSLSLAKRHTEVLRMHAHGLTEAPGRAYRGEDAPLTLALGLSATMAAVLILIVYLIEDAFPRQQYAAPQLLWAVPPILFLFLGRVWLLCQRGQLHDDPVAFAMKDRVSLALGFAMSAFAALALVGAGFK